MTGGALNFEHFNRVLLESAGVGLAVMRPESREIVFANKRFNDWFPGAAEGGKRIEEVLSAVDPEALRRGLDERGAFACEVSITLRRRPATLALQFARHVKDDVAILILECQNVSKIKEMEAMIESYSRMIEKQNRTLQREKERVEKLLLNIMPRSVYDELKIFGVTAPQKYEEASILMLDFVGFTEMAIAQDPSGVITELNDLFTAFDRIAEQFGCERIKTIGDAYMAVSGIPEPVPEHAQNIARLAILILRYLERRNASHAHQWRCRIGINTGTAIGSIVGVQKYVYDIFGPGVNLAARLEALSEPMEITLCEDMHRLIRNDFYFRDRGVEEIKGFGAKRIYTLDGARGVLEMRGAAETL